MRLLLERLSLNKMKHYQITPFDHVYFRHRSFMNCYLRNLIANMRSDIIHRKQKGHRVSR